MEHWKQPDPVGIPGAPIPDPMPIPDLRHAKSLATLVLKNATVRGLSQFRVDQLYSDLAVMQVTSSLWIIFFFFVVNNGSMHAALS